MCLVLLLRTTDALGVVAFVVVLHSPPQSSPIEIACSKRSSYTVSMDVEGQLRACLVGNLYHTVGKSPG
jgi:hypothetical protein